MRNKKIYLVASLGIAVSIFISSCSNNNANTSASATTLEVDTTPAVNETRTSISPQSTTPTSAPETTTTVPDVNKYHDGSLGVVYVPKGQDIQLRLINVISEDFAEIGATANRISNIATVDYGDIKGFNVEFGAAINDPCGSDAAEALAYDIVEDPNIVGILGPSCSASAFALSPVVTDAGITVLTGVSTSPSLTSFLDGEAGEDHYEGFYRTSTNDVYRGISIANFLAVSQGVKTASVIQVDQKLNHSFVEIFKEAFEALGGTIIETLISNDPAETLTQAAYAKQTEAEAIFFSLYPSSHTSLLGDAVQSLGGTDDKIVVVDGTVGDGVFNTKTKGIFVSLPERYSNNVNESTEATAAGIYDFYIREHGDDLYEKLPSWGQVYDATSLMLAGIESSSYLINSGDLIIHKQGLRNWLSDVADYQGISGTLTCDEFGDCGYPGILIGKQITDEYEDAFHNFVFTSLTDK